VNLQLQNPKKHKFTGTKFKNAQTYRNENDYLSQVKELMVQFLFIFGKAVILNLVVTNFISFH
jgi:hypothetical protein